MQEFRAARDCILRAFPGAAVQEDRVNEYPVTVTIFAPNGAEVWSGCQKGLFAKNGWRVRAPGPISSHRPPPHPPPPALPRTRPAAGATGLLTSVHYQSRPAIEKALAELKPLEGYPR